MKKLLLLAALFFIFFTAQAQTFPASFMGHWKGTLLWYQGNAKQPKKVPTQLIIQPADTAGQYTWQIIYGAQDNRPYLLKPVDTAKGHWVIDERNGILIHQYWTGNKFTSAFTVDSNVTIVASYWIENSRMNITFHTLSAKPVQTTGGTGKDVPPVSSYAVRGYQAAVLYKVKKQ